MTYEIKNSYDFEALEDKVLIRPADPESITAGGIWLPDSAVDKKPQVGDVIAVGPGRRSEFTGERMAIAVQPGFRVVFPKYAGVEIRIEHKDYLIVAAKDICLILHPKQVADDSEAQTGIEA